MEIVVRYTTMLCLALCGLAVAACSPPPETGKSADLVVLGESLMDVDPYSLYTVRRF